MAIGAEFSAKVVCFVKQRGDGYLAVSRSLIVESKTEEVRKKSGTVYSLLKESQVNSAICPSLYGKRLD